MFSLSPIKGNIDTLRELNNSRSNFNSLNKDLFSCYYSHNFMKKILLKRQISILLYDGSPIGYIWSARVGKKEFTINSMYVNSLNPEEGYRVLLNSFKYLSRINYDCQINNYNYTILKNLNFTKQEGTLKMCLTLEELPQSDKEEVTIVPFQKNRDEELRCSIQNSIFHNLDRVPLGVEDIISDLLQEYYIEGGSLFIRMGQEYSGYGQLIKDGEEAIIVNFGIIDKFRKKGLGKVLLCNLIIVARKLGYKRVFIKLNSNNIPAYNLYRSVGFKIHTQDYSFQLCKS